MKITTLQELDSICNAPMICTVKIGGQDVEIECQRLTPAQYAEIAAIEDQTIPPRIASGERAGQYDEDDRGYKQKRRLDARAARAVAVYYGCKVIRDGNPNLTDPTKIMEYIESKFTIQILRMLSEVILNADTSTQAVVDFTSPNSPE